MAPEMWGPRSTAQNKRWLWSTLVPFYKSYLKQPIVSGRKLSDAFSSTYFYCIKCVYTSNKIFTFKFKFKYLFIESRTHIWNISNYSKKKTLAQQINFQPALIDVLRSSEAFFDDDGWLIDDFLMYFSHLWIIIIWRLCY